LKIKINKGLTDILNFGKHIKLRNKIFLNAPDRKLPEGEINLLAKALHPPCQKLTITGVFDEAPGIKTFRLKPLDGGRIAPFRAGQYVSLSYESDGIIASRPYSLSSRPSAALTQNYYDITIKKTTQDAFFSQIVFSHWKEGVNVDSSGPAGTFYYEPLRDAPTIVCLAGGSGITPFRSIISEELKKHDSVKFHLFFGFNTPDQEIFRTDFLELEKSYPQRFSYHPVVMSPPGNGRKKPEVITLGMLKKTLGENVIKEASLFICGPRGFHEHMNSELSVLNLERKQIRRENFSPSPEKTDKTVTYQLRVMERGKVTKIAALSNETLITALERAGMNPPVLCRSGECGWCRSQLISGKVTTDDQLTGLRGADRKFNWIHPCVCFPESDITLRVPLNPVTMNEENPTYEESV
jgi:ferredoxin-NADP reductase